MKFSRATADVWVPDGAPPEEALRRTTHLCIAAHQDDIEIMAYHGIAACREHVAGAWFSGVVVTDGAGSPRTGRFADCTDEEMKRLRVDEQRKAATLGGYSTMIQLAHPSAAVKTAKAAEAVRADLRALLAAANPRMVYLHNPTDRHDTHVAVLHRCLEALRALPQDRRPARVLGCEVWRDLDWLVEADKLPLDVSADPTLAAELVAVFESQIAGGKRYDLAVAGRRLAHATFHASHATDRSAALTFAMDLSPLLQDDKLTLEDFALACVDRFRADVADRLRRLR